MPTGHLAKAPDLLVITAKKIADCVESYKASRYAGHYLITHEAIKDARNLLVDVEDLMRELAARREHSAGVSPLPFDLVLAACRCTNEQRRGSGNTALPEIVQCPRR